MLEGWERGVAHKRRCGNTESEMSLRHPDGVILLAVGDMRVQFGEVRARAMNVGVTDVQVVI